MPKTTLRIDDKVWIKVRIRAFEMGVSVAEYVNRILRAEVARKPSRPKAA